MACDDFQDGEAFLRGGGEQGRQLPALAGDTSYDINPHLEEVIASGQDGLRAGHLKEVRIKEGFAGVVVTLDGTDPERRGEWRGGPIIPGHRSFRVPWVFLAGGRRRGAQEETLGKGSGYALNP